MPGPLWQPCVAWTCHGHADRFSRPARPRLGRRARRGRRARHAGVRRRVRGAQLRRTPGRGAGAAAGHRPLKVLHVSDLHLTPHAGHEAALAGLARRPRARPRGQHRRQPRAPGLGRRRSSRASGRCSTCPGVFVLRLQRLLRARRCATRCGTSSPTTASATPRPPSCPGSDLRAAFDDARLDRPDQHAAAGSRSATPRSPSSASTTRTSATTTSPRSPAPRRPTPTCGSGSRTRRTCGCSTSTPATATT